MKLGIARAFNGEHRKYRKFSKMMSLDAFLFDIDSAKWLDNLKDADAYLWHADSKEHNYRTIHDRIYFIENILKKPVFPDMNMYFAYGDKVKEADIFKYHNIPTPKTHITYKKERALNLIERIKYPFILKDAHGYGGLHVKKIDNKKEAKEVIDKIFSVRGLRQGNKKAISIKKGYFFAQEFMPIEKDLRVIIIGNEVTCAYWRYNQEGWKNNVSKGARVSFDNIPSRALDVCLGLHKKMGFHWMSYDVFISNKGVSLMNEFSCNFGIKAPQEAGYEIRKMQVEYIKNYLNKYGKKKK